MIQIRKNVFETNSSNTHSLTMCTEADWLNWEKGVLVYSWCSDELMSHKEAEEKNLSERDLLTPDEFFDKAEDYGYETFKDTFRGIVAFGYYGYN